MAAVATTRAASASAGSTRKPTSVFAGGELAEPGQQRGERRLVDIAEGQVVPGGQEVQLVADVAVAGADRHLQAEGGHRDQRDPAGAGPGWARAAGPGRTGGCCRWSSWSPSWSQRATRAHRADGRGRPRPQAGPGGRGRGRTSPLRMSQPLPRAADPQPGRRAVASSRVHGHAAHQVPAVAGRAGEPVAAAAAGAAAGRRARPGPGRGQRAVAAAVPGPAAPAVAGPHAGRVAGAAAGRPPLAPGAGRAWPSGGPGSATTRSGWCLRRSRSRPAIAYYTVMDRSRSRSGAGSSPASWRPGSRSALAAPGHNEPYDAITQAFIFLTAGVAGVLTRANRASLTAAQDRADRAEAELDRESSRAAAQERATIARELHDVVAHHVSLMAVQAEAAASLLPAQPEQGEALGRYHRRHGPGGAGRAAAAARGAAQSVRAAGDGSVRVAGRAGRGAGPGARGRAAGRLRSGGYAGPGWRPGWT